MRPGCTRPPPGQRGGDKLWGYPERTHGFPDDVRLEPANGEYAEEMGFTYKPWGAFRGVGWANEEKGAFLYLNNI